MADVDDWQWRQVLLSEHGPSSLAARIVALTINAYMTGEKRYAWPSQPTIATRSQMSVRQVGRLVKQLRADGWLDVMKRRRDEGGHGWKQSVYFPTVPEHLAAHVPERPWKANPNAKRQDKAMSGPSKGKGNDRTSDIQRPDKSASNDRTFEGNDRTSGCPMMSSSEALKDVYREGALTSTALVDKREETRAKITSTKAVSKARAHRSLSDAAWLSKMIEAQQPVDLIAKASASSPQEVRRAIEALSLSKLTVHIRSDSPLPT